MFASQLKGILGQNITQTLRGVTGKSVPHINSNGMGQILDQVKTMGNGISGGL